MSASQNSCSTSRSPTRTIDHFPPPHPGLLARLHRQPDVGWRACPPGVYQRTAGSTIESAANTQAPDAARPTNQGALTMEKLVRGPPHRTTRPKGSGAGCRRGAVAGRAARLTTSIAALVGQSCPGALFGKRSLGMKMLRQTGRKCAYTSFTANDVIYKGHPPIMKN